MGLGPAVVGTGPGPRAALARGAALAGLAIAETRTTAAHGLSYPLTGRLGVPHGVAVALQLRWLRPHNAAVTDADCRHPAGAAAVRRLVADAERACGGDLDGLLGRLLARAGYPGTLAGLLAGRGLDPADWQPPLARALASSRSRNNPREIRPDSLLAALKEVPAP